MWPTGLSIPRGRSGRFGRTRSFQRRRRGFEWEGAATGLTIASGVTSAVILVPLAVMQDMTEPTLTRVRGNFFLEMVTGGGGDELVAACGIQVLPDGVGNESPHGDVSSNRWLWHQYIPLAQANSTVTGPFETSKFLRFTVDARAKRRCSDRDNVLFVVENVPSVGTPSIRLLGGARVLFQDG